MIWRVPCLSHGLFSTEPCMYRWRLVVKRVEFLGTKFGGGAVEEAERW